MNWFRGIGIQTDAALPKTLPLRAKYPPHFALALVKGWGHMGGRRYGKERFRNTTPKLDYFTKDDTPTN